MAAALVLRSICRLTAEHLQKLVEVLSPSEQAVEAVREATKKRSPALIVTLCLLADATLMISGQAFGDNKLTTFVVSAMLIVVFWAGNELSLKKLRSYRIAGRVAFAGGFVALILSCLCYHDWRIDLAWAWLTQLEPGLQVSLGLTALIFLIMVPVFLHVLGSRIEEQVPDSLQTDT